MRTGDQLSCVFGRVAGQAAHREVVNHAMGTVQVVNWAVLSVSTLRPVASEEQLQSELNLPGGRGRSGNKSRRRANCAT